MCVILRIRDQERMWNKKNNMLHSYHYVWRLQYVCAEDAVEVKA